MIRARLAVFVAAAIVFAPGAGLSEDSPQRPGPGVAARMLAPTFDEPEVAAYNPATFAKNAQEKGRRLSAASFALAVLVGAMGLADCRPRRLLGRRIQHHGRRLSSSHPKRGPPHLQLV